MTDLSYPIGAFQPTVDVEDDTRQRWIEDIESTPAQLRAVVDGLSDAQLDTPYRPEGWTVRQVVHHVADSHINSYVRFKWALTEDEPTIKVYDQDQWATLPEARSAPVDVSLSVLEAIHRRWVLVLRALSPDQLSRTLRHPELGVVTLDRMLDLYAWHGRHHVAHINALRRRMGWA